MTTINVQDRQLTVRGMPRDLLVVRPFTLGDYVASIDSRVADAPRRKVSKPLQLATHTKIAAAPFENPYIYIIASDPNDARAKYVAAHLMQTATRLQLTGTTRLQTMGRQTPLWHQTNGSYKDRLRDGADDQPSMLILSGITTDCTPVKLEKVRDLLEQFNYIPRVVAVTGSDPLTWANTRLRLAVNHVLYLANNRSISL